MVSLIEKLSQEKNFSENHPGDGCPECGEKIFWLDRYGNGPYCKKCRPWPSRSLVGKIFGDESREPEKKSDAEKKSKPVDLENISPEEFERMYTWYETRGDRNGNGKRLVIQRKDWEDSWAMISPKS